MFLHLMLFKKKDCSTLFAVTVMMKNILAVVSSKILVVPVINLGLTKDFNICILIAV